MPLIIFDPKGMALRKRNFDAVADLSDFLLNVRLSFLFKTYNYYLNVYSVSDFYSIFRAKMLSYFTPNFCSASHRFFLFS